MTAAAHLERVAKELALDCFRRIYWRDPDPDDAGHQLDLREFETAGAAALAACARESRKVAFEEAAKVVDGLQDSSVRRRMARLIRERAVGEEA